MKSPSNECIELPTWKGRPQKFIDGRVVLISRLILTIGNPNFSLDNMGIEACHTCDNSKCIRVEHLYLGTRKDNIADRGDFKAAYKTHCKRGHLLRHIDGKHLNCNQCQRIRRLSKIQGEKES